MPSELAKARAVAGVQTRRPPRCPACRDNGFILPELEYPYRWTGHLGDVLEWDGTGDTIPAGVLYREGVPCACEAGDQFRREQADWNRPMVGGNGDEDPSTCTKHGESGTVGELGPLTSADLDLALFGPRPKRTLPPISHRITAADFERLKGGR